MAVDQLSGQLFLVFDMQLTFKLDSLSNNLTYTGCGEDIKSEFLRCLLTDQ